MLVAVLNASLKLFSWLHFRLITHTHGVHIYRGADKSLARPGRKQAAATEDFDFSYILFIIIIWGILVLFIYIRRLASNEIFSPSNKIHREVGRAKDLVAPLYTCLSDYVISNYLINPWFNCQNSEISQLKRHMPNLNFFIGTAQTYREAYTAWPYVWFGLWPSITREE